MKKFHLCYGWSVLALAIVAATTSLTGCVQHRPSTPLLKPVEWRACPQVMYPVKAHATRRGGTVNAVLHVDSDGKVTSVDTSGDELFFRETINAFSKCKFPAGTADKVWRTVSFTIISGASVDYPTPEDKDVDDLFGHLPTNKGRDNSDTALSNYAGEIKSAIESKFYNAHSFAGKSCALRINLAPDGLLMKITAESGDTELCHAALTAAKTARIPAPPNQAVYKVFKNAPIDFKP